MTPLHDYRIADLHESDRLLNKIAGLETELGEELGHPVALIAYTPRHHTDIIPTDCRAGSDGD